MIYQVFVAQGWGYVPAPEGDSSYYASVAYSVWHGLWPYGGFAFEYPPLSILVFVLPPVGGTLAAYQHWFAVQMIVLDAITAVVTVAAATRIWPGLRRPLAAAVALAVAVVADGAIAVDRFDGAVALVLALALLCLVYRRWTVAAAVLGLGFALKLMPIVVVPLVLVLARTRRRVFWALAAAILAATIPFVPFVLHDAAGVRASLFGAQVSRGLQIESVAASPYLVAQLIHPGAISITQPVTASLTINGVGAALVGSLAPLIVLVLLAIVYAGVWRARDTLRAHNAGIPVTMLAAILATMMGNKVLSPQHLLWVLPLVALCLVGRQRTSKAAGALMLVALVLTQIEYPQMYFRQMHLDPVPLAIIAARNAVLVAAFVLAVITLWRLRRSDVAGPPSTANS